MQSRIEEIRSLDAEVLAISSDSPEDNQELAAKLDFPILSDVELTVIDAFGLRHAGASIEGKDIARPGVFIIGRDGQIAWRDLTDNWRVRVRPETILEQLKELP